MTTSTSYRLRFTLLMLVLCLLSVPTVAQSGRSWMKGIVFDDSDTSGPSGATVELLGDPNSERLRSVKMTTKTEEKGKYSMTNIPYGEYTFRVSLEGYETYEIKLYIGSDMLTQIHVKLKKKS